MLTKERDGRLNWGIFPNSGEISPPSLCLAAVRSRRTAARVFLGQCVVGMMFFDLLLEFW